MHRICGRANNSIISQIRNAIEAGEFDNLEGAGKPLDLDAYFNTPEDLRIGYSVLKPSRFVPEEVDRLKEIGELKEKVADCRNDAEHLKLQTNLQECQFALSHLIERNKRRKG